MKEKKNRFWKRAGFGLAALVLLAVLLYSPRQDVLTTRIVGESGRQYTCRRLFYTHLIQQVCAAMFGEGTDPAVVYSRFIEPLWYVSLSDGRHQKLEERLLTSEAGLIGIFNIIGSSDGKTIIIGGELGLDKNNKYVIQVLDIGYNAEGNPYVSGKREVFEIGLAPIAFTVPFFEFIDAGTLNDIKRDFGGQLGERFTLENLSEETREEWKKYGDIPQEVARKRQERIDLQIELRPKGIYPIGIDYGDSYRFIAQNFYEAGLYLIELAAKPQGTANVYSSGDEAGILITTERGFYALELKQPEQGENEE